MPNLHFFSEILKYTSSKKAKLIAVSKRKPNSDILELYGAGQRIFGENRVQEMVEKQAELPTDIEWHMIGHLQRKKVKMIAPFVSMIHSIDSLELLIEVNKRAKQHDRVIACLLQFHIGQESTKYGFYLQEVIDLLSSKEYSVMQNVEIVGVMGMATFTNNLLQVRSEFRMLKDFYDYLKAHFFVNQEGFKEISMGMSGDYEMAIEEGSTMIRIGSKLFGARN